jgi:hypothetical protein
VRWRVDLWDGKTPAAGPVVPKELAGLDLAGVDLRPCDKELKPEALEVLDESATSYHVVILSDGMCEGGPLEFDIPR